MVPPFCLGNSEDQQQKGMHNDEQHDDDWSSADGSWTWRGACHGGGDRRDPRGVWADLAWPRGAAKAT